jgi:hypothetical protein
MYVSFYRQVDIIQHFAFQIRQKLLLGFSDVQCSFILFTDQGDGVVLFFKPALGL